MNTKFKTGTEVEIERNEKLKIEYEVDWSHKQILWSPIG